MMEQLHYPMAGTIKGELQRQKQAQEEAAAQQAGMVAQAGTAQPGSGIAEDPAVLQAAMDTSALPEGGVTL